MVTLTPAQLAERLQSAAPPRLLDVREADEHAWAAIDGAKHIPLGALTQRLGELEPWKEREIVVYCHHGMRSLRAASFLAGHGFKVLNLTGGIDRWSLEVDKRVKRY